MIPPASRSATLAGIAALSLAMFLGGMHFVNSGRHLVWIDEVHTYYMARDGVTQVVPRMLDDVHPPIYFWLTALSLQIFGIEMEFLRLISILSAALLVPLVFWMFRPLLGDWSALGLAALVGLHPLLHFYAIEARSYAFLTLLLSATLLTVLRFVDRPNWCRGLLLFGCVTVSGGTHFIGLFAAPACVVAGLALLGTTRLKMLVPIILAAGAGAAVWLPFLLASMKNAPSYEWMREYWDAYPPSLVPLLTLDVLGIGGTYPTYLGRLRDLGSVPSACTGTRSPPSSASPVFWRRPSVNNDAGYSQPSFFF